MLIPLFHCPVNLPLSITLRCRLPFVIQFFTLAKTDLYLDTAAFEIHRQGNQRISVLLYLAQQTHDFPTVHQQTPHTFCIRIESVTLFVRGDVHLVDKKLAVFDAAPCVF